MKPFSLLVSVRYHSARLFAMCSLALAVLTVMASLAASLRMAPLRLAHHRTGGSLRMMSAAGAPGTTGTGSGDTQAGTMRHHHHHTPSVLTLSRFMTEATRNNPDHADLDGLIESIQIGCKTIAQIIARARIVDFDDSTSVRGPASNSMNQFNTNSGGLYNKASTVLRNALQFSGKIGIVSSEGEQHPILVEEAWNSNYVAVFDALDAVEHIDAGIVTGTIFGIFQEDTECLNDYGDDVSDSSKKCLLQNLKPSKNMVAAGYCMYSSTVVMMISLGNGLHGFTLDPSIGEFVLTHPNVMIPRRGQTYSINEGYSLDWSDGLKKYINDIKTGQSQSGQRYASRYIGSLVGDLHRTLLKGGIFAYPTNYKHPNGKLVFLHEIAPLAFLMEQAGGKASNASGQRMLDHEPKALTEHVATFMGSKDDMEELETYLK